MPAESRMSLRGSPAYRAAASRSAELSASTRIRPRLSAPSRSSAEASRISDRLQRRARMRPAAIATASTDSEDQSGGEVFSPSGFDCLASRKSIGLPRSCKFTRSAAPQLSQPSRRDTGVAFPLHDKLSIAQVPWGSTDSHTRDFSSRTVAARIHPTRLDCIEVREPFSYGRVASTMRLILHPPTNQPRFSSVSY